LEGNLVQSTGNIAQFKRDEKLNSNKLHLDKYYTSDETAQHCINVGREVALKNKWEVTEVIEPSAGNGVFMKKIRKHCIGYDIEPEGDGIIKQDFLKLDIPYKTGRLFIGNPPFGDRFNIGRQFIKKCLELGDFVMFILPISQYKNRYLFDDCELVYSENLGKLPYSDREVHCCFNIYKRDVGKKNDFHLPYVSLYESIKNGNPKRNKPYKDQNYDFRICSWGASAGRILKDCERYAKEIGFYISPGYKDKVRAAIEKANWKDEYAMTSTPNLVLWQVFDYLKRNVSEINQ
jgi:predicted RNA methylase